MYCSIAGTKYHPSTSCGSRDICCPGFSFIVDLVSGGARGVLLKSKLPSNAICAGSFGFLFLTQEVQCSLGLFEETAP